MAINFPSNPTLNQQYTSGDRTWQCVSVGPPAVWDQVPVGTTDAAAAATAAINAAAARDKAQQWATKTDGEVEAGQGRGAKYYADQAAATLANKAENADLADTTTATKGAGRIGFSAILNYAAGTLGAYVKSLVSIASLAAVSTVSIGGHNINDTQDILDNARTFQNYTALGAYTGRATGARITTPGIAGIWRYNTSLPNTGTGGIYVAHASGTGAWERIFDGAVFVSWFGSGNVAIQAALDTGFEVRVRGAHSIAAPLELGYGARLIADGSATLNVAAPIATIFKSKNTSIALQFVQVENLFVNGNNQATLGMDFGDLEFSYFRNIRVEKCIDKAWNLRIAPSLAATLTNQFINCYGVTSGQGLYLQGNTCQFIGGAFNNNTGIGVELDLANTNSFIGTDISGNQVWGLVVSGYGNSFTSIYHELNGSGDVWFKPMAKRTFYRRGGVSVSAPAATIDQGEGNDIDYGGGGSSLGAAASLLRGGDLSQYPVGTTLPAGIPFSSNLVTGSIFGSWTTAIKSRTTEGYLRLQKAAGGNFMGLMLDLDDYATKLAGKQVAFGMEIRGNASNDTVQVSGTLPRYAMYAYDAANAILAQQSSAYVTIKSADTIFKDGVNFSRIATLPMTIPAGTAKIRIEVYFAYANPSADTVIVDIKQLIPDVGGNVHFGAHTSVSESFLGSVIVPGDASVTAPPGKMVSVVFKTPLTADRTALPSAKNPVQGDRMRVTRTAAATGAFNVNVGAGTLKALAAGQWCVIEFDGAAWVLVEFGSL